MEGRDEQLHQKVDVILNKMNYILFDGSNKALGKFQRSLEFTQGKVDDLKRENEKLRKYVMDLESVVQKNVYQLENMEQN